MHDYRRDTEDDAANLRRALDYAQRLEEQEHEAGILPRDRQLRDAADSLTDGDRVRWRGEYRPTWPR